MANANKVFINRQINVESPMPENIGGVQYSWYDMEGDITHNFYCDDHRCNANHEGHRWEFEDERNSWVITLKHKQPKCLWTGKMMVSEMT